MREVNRITMVEARRIALEVLAGAEKERQEFAEREARRRLLVESNNETRPLTRATNGTR